MCSNNQQINNIFDCKKCDKRLDEPRLLPCGKSICTSCVLSIQLNLNNEYDCFLCNNKHEMSKYGLPINEALVELLSFESIKRSRSNAFYTLQESLIDIEQKKNLFEHHLNNSADCIKEYCVHLRNEVKFTSEQSYEQIKYFNMQMIHEINDYEQDLLKYNKNNLVLLKYSQQFRQELESFHLKTNQCLKQLYLNDDKLDNLNQEAVSLKDKAKLEIQNLKEIIFSGRFLKFKANEQELDKSFLGLMHEKANKMISFILNEKNQINNLMMLCDFPIDQKWRLIYRASQDGFEAAKFHEKCDDKPNTFILIKSENEYVFGGYTEQSWDGIGYKADSNAFIFSLVNLKNKPLKMKWSQNRGIYCFKTCGPTFGVGDIAITDQSNTGTVNWSNLGHSYSHPEYAYGSIKAQSFLAGSHKFQVSEIEVYIKQ